MLTLNLSTDTSTAIERLDFTSTDASTSGSLFVTFTNGRRYRWDDVWLDTVLAADWDSARRLQAGESYVNGKRVGTPVSVKVNIPIQVGSTIFELRA